MTTEENPALSHREPTSSSPTPSLLQGRSAITLNFKFHPGASGCCGVKQLPRAFCLPLLCMGNPPRCPCRGPQGPSFSCPLITTFGLYQVLSTLPPPGSPLIPIDSQFGHLCHLHPDVSRQCASHLPLPKLKRAKAPKHR